jgi:hypothetical protein
MCKALEYAKKKAIEDKSRASRKHSLEPIKDNYNCSVITDICNNTSCFDSNSAESSGIANTTLRTQNSTEVTDSVTDVCSTIVSNNNSNSVPTQHDEILKTNDGTQAGIGTHKDALLMAAETITMPVDGLAVMLRNAAERNPHEILPTPGGGIQFALLMSPSLQQPLILDSRLHTPRKYRPTWLEQGTQTNLEVIKESRSRRGKHKADSQIIRKDRKK